MLSDCHIPKIMFFYEIFIFHSLVHGVLYILLLCCTSIICFNHGIYICILFLQSGSFIAGARRLSFFLFLFDIPWKYSQLCRFFLPFFLFSYRYRTYLSFGGHFLFSLFAMLAVFLFTCPLLSFILWLILPFIYCFFFSILFKKFHNSFIISVVGDIDVNNLKVYTLVEKKRRLEYHFFLE